MQGVSNEDWESNELCVITKLMYKGYIYSWAATDGSDYISNTV
jgi:hypothetical protein